jgi:hypothetical protein
MGENSAAGFLGAGSKAQPDENGHVHGKRSTQLRLDGSKESRAGCENAASQVNVAHHAEVAILDENALKAATESPHPRRRSPRRVARQKTSELHVLHDPAGRLIG